MSGLPVLVRLENALGAALLRADLLGAARPVLAGRYEVRALLGRGARGVVVHARDARLDRELAVKLLPTSLAAETALAEARALAKLEHVNVVRVYDCDATTVTLEDESFEVSYVSMQLVRGATLRSFLATRDRTTAEILDIFRAVGEGLAAAHDAGLVHRDVKPDNVIVAEDGGVKVIDFGFASANESGAMTAGTRAYLAPEVGRGLQTAASDQYAFAIALEEALGERDVPAHVADALTRARSREPGKRHASMHALLRAMSPPRRRLMIAAATIALAIGCAALYVTGGTTSAEARRCAAAAGTFSFTGQVTDFVPGVNHEQWSAYRLKLVPVSDCRFYVEVTKYTDDAATGFYDWRGSSPDVRAEVGDGALVIETQLTLYRPNKTEPYEHAFTFSLEGERVGGTFDVLDRRSGFRRVYGGHLAGRRDRGSARP